MGFKSVLLRLESIENYREVIDFINNYDNQYIEMGLNYIQTTQSYYVLIECNGNFFVGLLKKRFSNKVYSLEEFTTIENFNSCKIIDAIYFNDENECLNHYQQNQSVSSG